jgi:hypothetical protein
MHLEQRVGRQHRGAQVAGRAARVVREVLHDGTAALRLARAALRARAHTGVSEEPAADDGARAEGWVRAARSRTSPLTTIDWFWRSETSMRRARSAIA